MAEARSATDAYLQSGVRSLARPDYEGYYTFTLRVPSFGVLASQVALSLHRAKHNVLNRIWPLSPLSVLTVMSGVTFGVVNAKGDSWVRSGWLAEALWRADSTAGRFNPLFELYPTSFRVGYLASGAAFVGLLGIVTVERLLLRLLLSWRGWIHGASTKLGKTLLNAWGVGVTVLTGRKNLTYAFDSSLPAQPLPSLKDTVERYLLSVKPLLSEEEFAKTVEMSKSFMKSEGKSFQRYLRLKHMFSSNYVNDWWEQYCYLYGRTPIAVNSNYYVLDSKERPTLDQIQRAAGLTHHFLRFKDLVESEQLEPMTIRGLIPLCMRQYERMFGTTRVPGRECDRLEHHKYSRHIVVVSRGHYYKLDVYHGAKGTKLRPYSTEELEEQFNLIMEHSKRQVNQLATSSSKPTGGNSLLRNGRIQSFEDLIVLDSMRDKANGGSGGLSSSSSLASFNAINNSTGGKDSSTSVKRSRRGTNIAAFTCGPRSRWAEVRETYLSDGVNRKSLRAIESAAFLLFLEDTHYSTNNERARSLFYGNGNNRWFDKSLSLIVYEDAYAGLNCEHSWADAPVIAHLFEFALLSELIDFQKKVPKKHPGTGDSVTALESTPEAKTSTALTKKLPVPKRLLWEVTDEFQIAIDNAYEFARAAIISDVDLELVEHDNFGKGSIKKWKLSPDGFVQMALQIAYFRNQGKLALTYESSMLRLFKLGRTETIRPLTEESADFVKAFTSGAPKDEVIAKLRTACALHASNSKDMMIGKGIDRHLFALYIVSKGMDRSSEFLNQALSMPWSLSTSQQPQDQTKLRKFLSKEVAARFVSPGGGFGPVSEDGYGISYMIMENVIFFHISSKISATNTSSQDMAIEVKRAMADLAELFQ
mmetsp:Transcript_10564/g.18703  ORF Transcript_10564/g.18703 Transcript_10564/m.18703 type:complete len:872 (+) Transcript_10564:155-2770(+)